ncbi:MAG: hypothetical protein JW818_20175 [Pirellulales bacterium]|nr:hypothetical protein [Pirellulales bacterium]
MFKTLTALNRFLATLLALAIVGLLGAGGWYGYQVLNRDRLAQQALEERDAQIESLKNDLGASREENKQLVLDLEEKRRQIRKLETANRLLKVDHRVAQLEVVSQQGSKENKDLVTKVGFVEVDEQGKSLDKMRVFNVEGDVVYVDAWVIKFSDKYVEQGDALRSTSICLFRRLFGESQRPEDGYVLDPVGARPAAYGLDKRVSPEEQELWSRFWDYANDPDKASEAGVRAAHGEAPSIKLQPGRRYRVLLRSSGGLSIATEPTSKKTSPPG